MTSDSRNNQITPSCLPPGLGEYISTWDNENIVNRILSKNCSKNETSPINLGKETNLSSKIEHPKDVKEVAQDVSHKLQKTASVEQPSFKLFGFEFAPIFIPIERRLQVFCQYTYYIYLFYNNFL